MYKIDNILYASSLCPSDIEKKILEYDKKLVGLQAQKYHRLLAKGFSKNGVKVTTLSCHPGLFEIGLERPLDISEESILYHLIPMKGSISHLHTIKVSFDYALCFLETHENAILICDVLNFSVAMGATLAAKKLKRSIVGIITDFPEHLFGKRSINCFLIWKLIELCTGYVVLTEQMRERLTGRKPSIVLEGHVDSDVHASLVPKLGSGVKQKICVYAGMLHRRYGIEKLVKAFILADVADSVLYIFGDGDYADELKQLDNEHIKFYGIVSNEVVVKYEKKATLLINPRPTEEEYTKYSFPSKNMEYMVSGTPVLTTKLPGMPDEYLPYVYLFGSETIPEMAKTIETLLTTDENELAKKGKAAQLFVLENKTNTIQAKKIIDFFEKI